jgi:hypothetical protein
MMEIRDVADLTDRIADLLFDEELDAESCTTGHYDGNFVHVADGNGRKFIIKVEEVRPTRCPHGEYWNLCEGEHGLLDNPHYSERWVR